MIWEDFKYKQLPRFYFYYENLGHQEKLYATKVKDSRERSICDDQYGEWLRAPISKRARIGDTTKSRNIIRSGSLKSRHRGEPSQSDTRGIKAIQQEGSTMKDTMRGNLDEPKRLIWMDCEKEVDRGRKQFETRKG